MEAQTALVFPAAERAAAADELGLQLRSPFLAGLAQLEDRSQKRDDPADWVQLLVELRWQRLQQPYLQPYCACPFHLDTLPLNQEPESMLEEVHHGLAAFACHFPKHSVVFSRETEVGSEQGDQVAAVEAIETAKSQHLGRLWELDVGSSLDLRLASTDV
jgi:hypothetical protein